MITGATGFIGSHLTELFVKCGYNVIAFDRYNPNNSWGWLENSELKDDFEVILGDIRDLDSVAKTMKNCQSVIHLAALIGIPYSYFSPLAYLKTNIEGTYNILESAKNLEIDQLLVTSTSEVYGTAQYVPIDERHPVVGQSPYSATKIAADQLSISYFRSFDLPVKIVRPFNTYGPRQSARAIIPTVISQIMEGGNTISLGSLTPTRDLTYVIDTCNGFLDIYKSKKLFGEITNIGMNSEISVKNLVKLISDLMDKDVKIKSNSSRIRPVKSEVERLVCDNSKLKNKTMWKPAHNLTSGLKETINWMQKNKNTFKPKKYNI